MEYHVCTSSTVGFSQCSIIYIPAKPLQGSCIASCTVQTLLGRILHFAKDFGHFLEGSCKVSCKTLAQHCQQDLQLLQVLARCENIRNKSCRMFCEKSCMALYEATETATVGYECRLPGTLKPATTHLILLPLTLSHRETHTAAVRQPTGRRSRYLHTGKLATSSGAGDKSNDAELLVLIHLGVPYASFASLGPQVTLVTVLKIWLRAVVGRHHKY